jgi:hypothetical protein
MIADMIANIAHYRALSLAVSNTARKFVGRLTRHILPFPGAFRAPLLSDIPRDRSCRAIITRSGVFGKSPRPLSSVRVPLFACGDRSHQSGWLTLICFRTKRSMEPNAPVGIRRPRRSLRHMDKAVLDDRRLRAQPHDLLATGVVACNPPW